MQKVLVWEQFFKSGYLAIQVSLAKRLIPGNFPRCCSQRVCSHRQISEHELQGFGEPEPAAGGSHGLHSPRASGSVLLGRNPGHEKQQLVVRADCAHFAPHLGIWSLGSPCNQCRAAGGQLLKRAQEHDNASLGITAGGKAQSSPSRIQISRIGPWSRGHRCVPVRGDTHSLGVGLRAPEPCGHT